jgi:hypothetical protein
VACDRRAQGFAALNQLLQGEIAMPAHGENERHGGKKQEERPKPLRPGDSASLLVPGNGHVSDGSLAQS